MRRLSKLLIDFGNGLLNMRVDIVLSVAGSLIAVYKAYDWIKSLIDNLSIGEQIRMVLLYPISLILFMIFTAFVCFTVLRVVGGGFVGTGKSIGYWATRPKHKKDAKIVASIMPTESYPKNGNFLRISLLFNNNEAIDLDKVNLDFQGVKLISKYLWSMNEKTLVEIHRWVGHEMEWEVGDSEKTGYSFIPGKGEGIIRLFEVNSGRNEFSLHLAKSSISVPSIGIGKYLLSFGFSGSMEKRNAQRDLEVEIDYRGGKDIKLKLLKFK